MTRTLTGPPGPHPQLCEWSRGPRSKLEEVPKKVDGISEVEKNRHHSCLPHLRK